MLNFFVWKCWISSFGKVKFLRWKVLQFFILEYYFGFLRLENAGFENVGCLRLENVEFLRLDNVEILRSENIEFFVWEC